jgi:cysteine-rich repeat protein
MCLYVAACGARTGLATVTVDANLPDDVVDVLDVMEASSAVDVVDVVDVADVADIRDAISVDGVISSVCGNGVLEAGEVCDLGGSNALVPAFAISQAGRPEIAVQPVVRRVAAAVFYRYESASAHTGFEASGLSNSFLYVNALTNDLALFFIAGHDDDLGGTPQPRGDMNVLFRGLPNTVRIAVSDDDPELSLTSAGEARGRWGFNGNTDGGALNGLPWETPWRVVIEPTYTAGVTSARYVLQNATGVSLVLRDALAIEHRVVRSLCRPDCRPSRCGDGFLDASERCDDANTRSGDGCSATCDRIE